MKYKYAESASLEKKNKQNKIKMVSSSKSSLSFMKELKWNRRHDFCYILYTQTGDKLKLEVVFVGGGVGQQLNTPWSAIQAG